MWIKIVNAAFQENQMLKEYMICGRIVKHEKWRICIRDSSNRLLLCEICRLFIDTSTQIKYSDILKSFALTGKSDQFFYQSSKYVLQYQLNSLFTIKKFVKCIKRISIIKSTIFRYRTARLTNQTLILSNLFFHWCYAYLSVFRN